MPADLTPAALSALSDYLPGAQPADRFKHTFTLHTPAFSTLPALRHNMRGRLDLWGLPSEYSSMLEFTATEIMTNLIKHPARKAKTVRITLHWHQDTVSLDISDDATPFASFVAECNRPRPALANISEAGIGGFGLPCLRELHSDMRYIMAGDSTDKRNHFIVTIPWPNPLLVKAPGDCALPAQIYLTAQAQDSLPLICLIDDNAATLAMHAQQLERYYRVASYTHAADALAACALRLPDLIIADMSLADMDGVTFRQRLCSLQGGSQIPFVFLSSSTGRHQETDAGLTGIDDYLCKPVTDERLQSVVARLLRRSRQIAASVHDSFDRKINRILHPELPADAHGWRIVIRSSRAEAGGGDFILYHNEEDRLFGVVADVMGHGRDAKFFSCAYAGYLRSFLQVLRPACSPGPFLEKLSAAIHTDSFFDLSAMTCLAFELCRGGEARLAIAGHPPPRLCEEADGMAQACQLDMTGPLPGLTADNRYTQTTLQLAAGARLLLATDGYWNIAEKREALHTALETAATLDAERAADLLWQAHIDHSRASLRPQDDTTLILIEAGGAP